MRTGDPREIFSFLDRGTTVVAIDEAQFFSKELTVVCQELAARGIKVIVAGLDLDFKRDEFGAMGDLIEIAEKVDKRPANCEVCGGSAFFTQRLIDDGSGERKPARRSDPVKIIGGKNLYEPRCEQHHLVLDD